MNSLKYLVILGYAVVLQGCGTITNHYTPAKISTAAITSEQNGLVLVSTGANEGCLTAATFIGVVDAKTKKGADPTVFISVDSGLIKSDFDSHQGIVSAFSLPPGTYYFAPSIASPYVRSVKIPTFNFDVYAGETTYLGEIFMPISCNLNTSFKINDMFERDWKVALAKNPGLAVRDPVKRFLTAGEDIIVPK